MPGVLYREGFEGYVVFSDLYGVSFVLEGFNDGGSAFDTADYRYFFIDYQWIRVEASEDIDGVFGFCAVECVLYGFKGEFCGAITFRI